jgi:hypothetical protein
MLFLLCLLSYGYFYQGGGWNQNSRFDLTRAIVEQHSFAIDAYADNTGDVSAREGHLYCDKAPGQSLLAAPIYALLMHGESAPGAARLNDAAYVITLVTVALPSAVAVWVLFHLLLRWGTRGPWAVAVALGWGLASMAWPYATMLFGHQLVAALLLCAFALLVAEGRPTAGASWGAGLLLGLACTVEYQALLGAIAIGALALRGGPRSVLRVAGGALPALAVLAYYHWQAFGAPWTLAYAYSTMPYRHQGYFMGLGIPDPVVLKEITLGSYRGLFHSSPWLLFGLPGALLWLSRGRIAGTVAAAGVVLLYLWMNASLVDWQGGWSYGPRFLVPALPFLALLVGGLGAQVWHSAIIARVLGLLFALALLVSFAATLVAVAVNPQTPLGMQHPYADYLLPQWQAGNISLANQGITMKWPTTSQAPASWNLGQRLGFSGRASLLPLLAAQLMLGGLLFAATRRKARASIAESPWRHETQ